MVTSPKPGASGRILIQRQCAGRVKTMEAHGGKVEIMEGQEEKVKTMEDRAERAKILGASAVRAKMWELAPKKKAKTLAACEVTGAILGSQFLTTTWRWTQ